MQAAFNHPGDAVNMLHNPTLYNASIYNTRSLRFMLAPWNALGHLLSALPLCMEAATLLMPPLPGWSAACAGGSCPHSKA